jgi:NAD+ synthase
MQTLAAHLVDWIRREVTDGGGGGAVFGLSGGIDSAVVAALAKQAFPHHTLGVVMPCHSLPQDADDAQLVAHHFDVPACTIDLAPVYDLLLAKLGTCQTDLLGSQMATANLKPRLRMTTLYAFANQLGYRVLGTGNRSEIAVGYYTKYGDGGADLLPLGELVKTEVRQLAAYLDVPRRIIDKPPSAGLWADQTDEAEMGLTYEELDAYLLTSQASPAVKAKVDALHAASQHKRELPRVAPKPGA